MGSDLAAGTLVAGKFRVGRKLGEGAMGAVYAAKHEVLGVDVAMKVLLPAVARDPQFVARFLQEARSAARIEGEHIARVSDVGELDDGVPFMVMELLEGEDLAALIERTGALEPGVAVAYLLQALAGVLEAHDLGVVHRDLKPSNLFVVHRRARADKVKVLDFGISKSGFDKSGNITTTGATMGSPAYMSPEQVRSSKSVDARADIWSMGVIAYELLTGTMPFAGESVGATFAAILETVPEPPQKRNDRVPAELGDIVMRCLKRDPAERFQTTTELIDALTPFAAKLPLRTENAPARALEDAPASFAETVAAPEIVTQHTWGDGLAPRKRAAWAAVAIAVTLSAVLAFVFVKTRSTESAPHHEEIAATASTSASTESASVPSATVSAAPSATPSVSVATPAALSTTKHHVATTASGPKAVPSASVDTSTLFRRH